jgi:hypothetical protein
MVRLMPSRLGKRYVRETSAKNGNEKDMIKKLVSGESGNTISP